KSKSYRGAQEHKDLYHALVKSYKLDKDLFESFGKVYSLKRDREGKEKDEDLPLGSYQGLKKQKTTKDVEPSKGSNSEESKSSSSKSSKSQSKSTGKSAQAEEPVFKTVDTEMPLNQGEDLGNTDDQPDVEEVSKDDWFKKPKRPSTPDSDWNTTMKIDLDHLRLGSTKLLKADKYDTIKEIEDMVPSLWSLIYASNRKSKHDVLSTKRITAVTHVKKKLSNLERDDLFDLNVALQMFTRHVVILKRVEDLQLGVEKKLNLTRVLHDIECSLEMDYLPKITWSKLDRKRSRIMIKAIDQQLFERRLMRNLEEFVGGRDYREDFRLLEQTI
nr:hypothetical protein [Tanacetum cinerariifolium]